MANYYNSQSLSWLVTSTWIPGMGSEWMSVSVFYKSSLREILSHASNVVHLKKRCTARLCEVGTKGFFYLYRRNNTTMLDTSAADVNPLDESMDQYWASKAHEGAIKTASINLCTPLTPGITIKHVKMLLKIFEKSMFHLELLIYYLN